MEMGRPALYHRCRADSAIPDTSFPSRVRVHMAAAVAQDERASESK